MNSDQQRDIDGIFCGKTDEAPYGENSEGILVDGGR